MSERITPNPENISAKLLATLRRLFGDIESQGNVDLRAEANEVKRLIFEQLVARGKIDPDTSYETWVQDCFPGTTTVDNSRLIELAKENNLISNSEESEFLKASLRQIHKTYRSLTGRFINTPLSNEVNALLANEEVTLDDYRYLADKIIREIYG